MQIQELHTSKALKKANNVLVSCKEVNSSSLVYDNISYIYVTNTAMNYNLYFRIL